MRSSIFSIRWSWKRFFLLSGFILSILLISKYTDKIYRYFFCVYRRQATRIKLRKIHKYNPDEYVNFMTSHLILPLREDKVQLFGFLDDINSVTGPQACASMYSAASAGWKYQLVGPKSFPNLKIPSFDTKMKKLVAIEAVSSMLSSDVITIFADSMDIVYQRNAEDFLQVYKDYSRRVNATDKAIYNGETICWPFQKTKGNVNYHCELMQGW